MDHKKTGRHADTQSAAAILSSSTPPALDHNTISSTTSKRQSAAHPRMITIRGTSDHHHLESVITIGWNDRSPSLECAARLHRAPVDVAIPVHSPPYGPAASALLNCGRSSKKAAVATMSGPFIAKLSLPACDSTAVSCHACL